MLSTELASIPSPQAGPLPDQLRRAVSAYLACFKGSSREHTESDLRCYLTWCAERGLDPLAAQRQHLELYIRWMQETRRFKPSTISRRFSVTAGFYRTCAIDGVLEHSPAEHVRRPTVPAESPTLGFTHLQFEAVLTAARQSPDLCDFALVAMLGLLGLRIFEATSADIADLGEEHGHRVLRVCGKGTKVVLVPLPPAVGRAIDPGNRRPDARAGPAQQPRQPDGPARGHPPPAPARRDRWYPGRQDTPAHAPAHVRHYHARRRGRLARCPDRRPPRRPAHHDALRQSPPEPGPPP
jgi:integrase/recombinase XerD